MDPQQDVRQVFEETLAAFLEVVKQDHSILAALLFGSLVEGNVWEKSDIDLILVSNDEKNPYSFYWIEENNLNLQVSVYSRNRFKRFVEGALAGSWVQHVITTGKLLFSRDRTIDEYLLQAQTLGKRDVELQLLTVVWTVTGDLEKAEKFLFKRGDVAQSYLFVTRMLDRLAQIEVLLHGEIPGREVIEQALHYNPELFHAIFTDVILERTDERKLRAILGRIRRYLETHTPVVFGPVIEYFKAEGDVRSTSDLTHHLNKMMPSAMWEVAALGYGNWLEEQGILARFSAPVRLTSKSRVQVNQVGYIYNGDEL